MKSGYDRKGTTYLLLVLLLVLVLYGYGKQAGPASESADETRINISEADADLKSEEAGNTDDAEGLEKEDEGGEETMIYNGDVSGGVPIPAGGSMPGGNQMPGGSTTAHGIDAQKTIQSQDITSFEVVTNFESVASAKKYTYVYGYASKVEDGVLVALIYKANNGTSQGDAYTEVALVDEGIFAELQNIVQKYEFEKSNGYSHNVNGLPQNFGGSAYIEYSSGESISFNDNQSPIMSPDAGAEIADVIKKYISGKSIKTLSGGDITAVRYREDRDGGYADYFLEGNKLISENKYGDAENMYLKNEKEVPADAMDKIRQMADAGVLLHWKGLREIPNPVFPNLKQQAIFTMKDGSERIINSNMKGPGPANNSVFEIQMYLQNQLGQ